MASAVFLQLLELLQDNCSSASPWFCFKKHCAFDQAHNRLEVVLKMLFPCLSFHLRVVSKMHLTQIAFQFV